MRFCVDFHIHSRFSRATSKELNPENLDYWARLKGVDVVGTGDCTHPGWVKELKEKLTANDHGLLHLKPEYYPEKFRQLPQHFQQKKISFILTGEVSTIYKKNDATRKVHHLLVFPDFSSVDRFQEKLGRIGNITSDGRPIVGLDSKLLLEMVLDSHAQAYLIPAHIWTPWFSVLGSKSGFDRIEDCYEDLTSHIFALETGLSSDPPMNRVCRFLDRFALVSNSDAHSPDKLAREANLFDCELSYAGIYSALKTKKGFLGTVEFFPQEGKYHYDGHRNCNVCLNPLESLKNQRLCPQCQKPLTLGVMYRVAELADRRVEEIPQTDQQFFSTTSLIQLWSEILNTKTATSKTLQEAYFQTLFNLGSELDILLLSPIESVAKHSQLLAEGVRRLRAGRIRVEDGYDGAYGRITVFEPQELTGAGQTLFSVAPSASSAPPKKTVEFDIESFKALQKTTAVRSEPEPSKRKPVSKEEPSAPIIEGTLVRGRTYIIQAGPGTGKTHLLTHWIEKLIKDDNVSPEHILAVTFSNYAADEMRSRLQPKLNAAMPRISTLHAFGFDLIKQNNPNKNWALVDETEKELLLKNAFKNRRECRAALDQISKYKQGILATVAPDLLEQDRAVLSQAQVLDLDDLIAMPVDDLKNNPEFKATIQEQYHYIFVDEAQDLNPKQYHFISELKGLNTTLFVIGDPDQSIYGFRGADPKIMTRFQTDAADAIVLSLKHSYRCPTRMLQYAGQIIARPETLNGHNSGGIEIKSFDTEKQEADFIAQEIEKLMGGFHSLAYGTSDSASDGLSFSDIAILCRARFQFDAIAAALRHRQISYRTTQANIWLQSEPVIRFIGTLKSAYFQWPTTENLDPPLLSEIKTHLDARLCIKDLILRFAPRCDVSDDAIKALVALSQNFEARYDDWFTHLALRSQIDECDVAHEAVSLMSLHAAKGLTFQTIFLAGCEDNLLPFELFGPKTGPALEEEARLFYVGLTRARNQVYITHARTRMFQGRRLQQSMSRFLLRPEKLFQPKIEIVTIPDYQTKLF